MEQRFILRTTIVATMSLYTSLTYLEYIAHINRISSHEKSANLHPIIHTQLRLETWDQILSLNK